MKIIKTQVGIIGAGPAGLLLGQMLQNRNIETVIIENKDREFVRTRLRAGVQEQETADTFVAEGVGENIQKKGIVHDGKYLFFDNQKHYLNTKKLTGKSIIIYGQQEITCDMIDVREAAGLPLFFEAKATKITDIVEDKARIYYTHNDEECMIECDYVAGCDGFHGISRHHIPKTMQKIYTHEFPFAWFGVLAGAPPACPEVAYAHSEHGFALQSMRGKDISRLYIQAPPDEKIKEWSEDQYFDEFERRLGAGYKVNRGPIIERTLAQIRSYVSEPMRYGRLFLVGDSSHIVPATGAKGMNLAVADARVLSAGLSQHYHKNSDALLNQYSEICLYRIWIVERYTWWFTMTMHKVEGQSEFETKMQLATLHYLTSSTAGGQSLAENYVGLPFYLRDTARPD